jgi:NAD(P)-dependent dehydrogenase (short-subunit alcohol dehydrogenase family)
MQDMFSLATKVAFVTGAARGIGLAIATGRLCGKATILE